MPTYQKAPTEVGRVAERMIEKYHAPLRDAKVSIDFLLALAKPDEFGVALKLHGYPVAAIAKVIPYKLRVQGHADCEIVIDGDQWPTWSDEQCEAIIDHELQHFELKEDKDGLIVRDDLDRPKLKMRRHDHQFGWFDAIARRHGSASFEVSQAKAFYTGPLKQLWLPYMREEWPDLKPAESFPARLRMAKVVEGVVNNIGVTVEIGEEYDAVITDDGEIAAQVGNHVLPLTAGQFDVIEWRDESAPAHKPRRKREAAVA